MGYTLHHLLKLGFKASAINYQVTKGKLDHIQRVRPGGDRLYSAQDILYLGELLNFPITEEQIKEVSHES